MGRRPSDRETSAGTKRSRRILLLSVCAALLAASCGLAVEGQREVPEPEHEAGLEASPPPRGDSATVMDATVTDADVTDGAVDDAADGDAGPPPMLHCGDASVTTCSGCEAGVYACNATGTCVDDCKAGCSGSPVQCLGCVADASLVTNGVCETEAGASACITPPFGRCPCSGTDPSACPGERQVCVGSQCIGCGEPATDGLTCRLPMGKHCKFGSGPDADQLTCK